MGSEAVDAATPSEPPANQSGLSVLHSRFGRIHLDPALGGLAQKNPPKNLPKTVRFSFQDYFLGGCNPDVALLETTHRPW